MKKYKPLTIRELNEKMKKDKEKGLNPYLKANKGSVKIQYG